LSAGAFLDAPENERPPIRLSELGHGEADGLIALTGGPDGPINRALADDQPALALERLMALKALFGDRLYVELQRHGLGHESKTEPGLLELAYAQAVPIVATNEGYFPCPEHHEAHDALLCIVCFMIFAAAAINLTAGD